MYAGCIQIYSIFLEIYEIPVVSKEFLKGYIEKNGEGSMVYLY